MKGAAAIQTVQDGALFFKGDASPALWATGGKKEVHNNILLG
jgi:hypothetical protein